LSDLI